MIVEEASVASVARPAGPARQEPPVAQVQLLPVNAYRLLGEVLPAVLPDVGAPVVVDGGANVGEASLQALRFIRGAVVHAFEPVGDPFARLAEVATGSGGRIRAHRLALGERVGEAEINVNQNLWTSSLLPASERAIEYHGDWCVTARTEAVRVTTLDAWAQAEGVGRVDVLKLDLQGFELPALRGAERVLAGATAVLSEAQFIPEYEGASLFGDIDTFLRARGFGLYQMTDLCLKGRHAEPSCCDGLWLRQDALDRVRRLPTPGAILKTTDGRADKLAAALQRCADQGLRRVAIYGAGAHTLACGEVLGRPPVEIVAILDDSPDRIGGRMWNFPIAALADAERLGIDAIVISSDRAEPQLRANCDPLADRGLAIVPLYADGV